MKNEATTGADKLVLWTVRNVAEATGQHYQTARAWLLSGAVPLVHLPSGRARGGVSKRILVRKADVLRLINESTEQV
jgi:predicted site-specific integrase-resolvase